jgi:hypothetical protein
MATSFKSNIGWTPAGKTGGYLWNRDAGTVQDILAAANATHNWTWNTAAGNEGGGYNHNGDVALFSTGAPADAGSGDPLFVDSTRNLATWDASLGGLGTVVNALAELSKVADASGWDPDYNVAALLVWVKAGSAPRNKQLYNRGHDGRTLGAVEFVASASTDYIRRTASTDSTLRRTSESSSVIRRASDSSDVIRRY